MRISKPRKADEVLLPYHPYSDRGESLCGNSQLLTRLTIAIRELIQEHPCNDVGTKLLIMLVVKQQVNKPLLIPDLRGLVFCQTIEVVSSGSQILLSVTPVKGASHLRDHKMYRGSKCTCRGVCKDMQGYARICKDMQGYAKYARAPGLSLPGSPTSFVTSILERRRPHSTPCRHYPA
jgi:hypothetical protein